MTLAATLRTPQPLSELNTTPLIDVLLVLLILFVITMPPSTHSIELALPGPSACPPVCPPIDRVENAVTVGADGAVRWNGGVVSQSELAALLALTLELPREPLLRFEPESGARYALAAETIRTIKLSGVSVFGISGNERFSEFDKPL